MTGRFIERTVKLELIFLMVPQKNIDDGISTYEKVTGTVQILDRGGGRRGARERDVVGREKSDKTHNIFPTDG